MIKVEHLAHSIEQTNYTNAHLQTLGEQSERIENILNSSQEKMENIRRNKNQNQPNLQQKEKAELKPILQPPKPFAKGVKLSRELIELSE